MAVFMDRTGFRQYFFPTCLRKAFLCTLNLAVTFVAVSFHIGRIWVVEQGQVALNGWSRVVGGGVYKTGKGVLGSCLGSFLCTQAHSHLDRYLMKDLHPPLD